MAALGAIGTIASLAGAVAGVGQSLAQAKLEKIQGQRQTQQLQVQQTLTEKKAKQEMAIATHAASKERKKAEYAKSRAMSLAAKSGAAGYDPYQLDAEGDYNVLAQLYSGKIGQSESMMRANQLELEKAATATRSKYDRYGSYARGVSHLADAGDTMYERFGKEKKVAA